MWYVYILESKKCPGKYYTGFTNDLKRRFAEHNAVCNSGHTAKYRPWALHTYMAFCDKKIAQEFEAYLKTQAGRRFQKMRLNTKKEC